MHPKFDRFLDFGEFEHISIQPDIRALLVGQIGGIGVCMLVLYLELGIASIGAFPRCTFEESLERCIETQLHIGQSQGIHTLEPLKTRNLL